MEPAITRPSPGTALSTGTPTSITSFSSISAITQYRKKGALDQSEPALAQPSDHLTDECVGHAPLPKSDLDRDGYIGLLGPDFDLRFIAHLRFLAVGLRSPGNTARRAKIHRKGLPHRTGRQAEQWEQAGNVEKRGCLDDPAGGHFDDNKGPRLKAAFRSGGRVLGERR